MSDGSAPIGTRGEDEIRSGYKWMWLSGAAVALGIFFIIAGLVSTGDVDGRRVIYTIIATLGIVRGFLLYRDGKAKQEGREVAPREYQPGAEKKVIMWVVGIAAAIILFALGVAILAE